MTTQVEIVDEVVGTEPLLSARQVTMQFGGLTAVNKVDSRHPRGRDRRPDRPERGREDDLLQLPHRHVQAHLRAGAFAGEVLPPKPRKAVVKAGVAGPSRTSGSSAT
jgi:branched-chain amino acid transport system ATP-binding protein